MTLPEVPAWRAAMAEEAELASTLMLASSLTEERLSQREIDLCLGVTLVHERPVDRPAGSNKTA